jgi:hypothetical protein
MAIFKRNKSQKLDAILAELRTRDAALVEKRAAAEAAFAEAMASRQSFMLSGDLSDEQAAERLQHRVESAQSRLNGLISALDALQIEIGSVEAKIAAERESIERQQAADRLAQQIGAVETALPDFMMAGRTLADALVQIGSWHFESGAMANFIRDCCGQVELASAFAMTELRAMPDAVREGRQAIPRDEPEPEPIAVIEQPPVETVFMLRSAKYRDHEGNTRHAGQYEDAALPVEAAQRALRYSIAVPLADPRRRELHGARGGRHVNVGAPDIADLTSEAAARPRHAEPILASDPVLREADFRVIDRSAENRVVRIPAR